MSEWSSFVDVLRAWSALKPENTALTFLEDGEFQGRELSYKSLDRLAGRVAAGIAGTVRKGDRVLLLHPPGLEFVTAFFGCLYAGVVPVPAYPPRNSRHFPRIEAILADADVRCILTESGFSGRLSAWLDQRRLNQGASALPVLCTDTLDDHPGAWQLRQGITPETLAFLQYTSGSTGEPKGVMITHGNLIANQQMIRQAFGHSEGLIQVSWLPVYHDMGLIGNLMQPLFLGGHCIFMSPVAFLQKPRRWLAAISRFRAQGSGAPNFALRLCTRSVTGDQKAGLDLSSLRVFFVGSEPINPAVLEEFAESFRETGFRREAFYCCYGMAETTLLATGSVPDTGPIFEMTEASTGHVKLLAGCGKAAEGQELAIVDPDRGIRLGDGAVGEIWLRGANVSPGYWRKPELTETTFRARLGNEAGYLRTGDLGFLLNSELFVTGRMKDLLIIRGRNHYPQDIENTVERSHAALSPNACAAVSVENGGEETAIVIAEIQRSVMRSLNAEEIFGSIRRAVFDEHDLAVHEIVLIRPATLPRTSSGKVRRGECREQFLAGSLDALATWRERIDSDSQRPAEARSDGSPAFSPASIEAWLRNWIADRMGKEPSEIDPEMVFADSGLDSVGAVRLSTDLSGWIGLDVSPTLVWDFPTIRLASKYLAGRLVEPETEKSLEESAAMLAAELASLTGSQDSSLETRL